MCIFAIYTSLTMKKILRDFFMYTHMWQTWINHREDLITTLFGLIVILFVFFFGIIFFPRWFVHATSSC